jgi:hypothetical protein
VGLYGRHAAFPSEVIVRPNKADELSAQAFCVALCLSRHRLVRGQCTALITFYRCRYAS